MAVLDAARLGIARIGATRLGYPIAQGVVLPKYALLNVARLGATRLNYHSPKVFVSIAGVQYATARLTDAEKVLDGSLTITDTLNATPNTARCLVKGFLPTEGQEVIVTLGSINNLNREFAGSILSLTHSYVGTPANYQRDLNLIDYTWGLNKRKVTVRYTSTTVGVIAADLVATYASGYTLQIDADIAAVTIDEITFTLQDLTACLTHLTKRVGGDWVCDYHKVVRLFFAQSALTNPTILNTIHPTLTEFSYSRDLGQLLTRAIVEGGGTNALQDLSVGTTILPFDGQTAPWYPAAGVTVDGIYTETTGFVNCGPQRISYTSVDQGNGGGLVGPGASPTGASALALAAGAGIESGSHDYAATFITAAGESLPSPISTIVVGAVSAPVAAPTAGTPTIGSGPDVGSHDYAMTLVTASGETTPGPRVTQATGVTTAPTVAPTPDTPIAGAGVDPGSHDYAYTFVTAVGETTPSPVSGQVTTSGPDDPTTIGTPSVSGSPGGGGIAGNHRWKFSFRRDSDGKETAATPASDNASSVSGQSVEITLSACDAEPSGYTRKWYRTLDGGSTYYAMPLAYLTSEWLPSFNFGGTLVFYDAMDDSFLRPTSLVSGITRSGTIATVTTSFAHHYLTGDRITISGAVQSGYNLSNVVITVTGTATFTYDVDAGTTSPATGTIYAQLTSTAPTVSAVQLCHVHLTGIKTGGSDVTSRKLYRRSGVAGLKLVGTGTSLSNNSTTTYTDDATNASLGAAVPSVSTAYAQRIPLTNLPLGGALVTSRKLYGTAAGGSQLKYIATLNTTDTAYTVTTADGSLGANVPTVNTAAANQVTLTGVPIGAASVTSRWLYRTAVGSSQLKRLHQLADNTTATYLDSIADASLGASVPVTDTSGLTQPSGNVLAGSTALIVAGTGAFSSAGGWAIIGNGTQVIRYTGVTGSSLTGIPATGTGSIVATIGYNSTVTAAPCLRGVPASGAGSILYAIKKGDPVNLVVQVDDVAAQTALAALIGGDGIQEDALQDNRLSSTEAIARGEAHLALHDTVAVQAHAKTRDINTRAGRTLSVNLGTPTSVTADFLIQTVTESGFAPALFPTFETTGASVRLTFEDYLRLITKAA